MAPLLVLLLPSTHSPLPYFFLGKLTTLEQISQRQFPFTNTIEKRIRNSAECNAAKCYASSILDSSHCCRDVCSTATQRRRAVATSGAGTIAFVRLLPHQCAVWKIIKGQNIQYENHFFFLFFIYCVLLLLQIRINDKFKRKLSTVIRSIQSWF